MAEIRVTVRGGAELATGIEKFGTWTLDLTDPTREVDVFVVELSSGAVFVSRGVVTE